MKMSWKIFVIAGSSALVCGVAYKLLKRSTLFTKFEKQCQTLVNEVLFYGVYGEEQNKKKGLDNLYCIYYIMIHAGRSIDVCMPSLSSETITKCLLDVHSRNKVQIRVVLHKSDNYDQVLQLAQNGIDIKVMESDKLEHEFILVDASENSEAVALIGSLDYEVQRVNCNRDSTLVTSDSVVINSLRTEFERVWNHNAIRDFTDMCVPEQNDGEDIEIVENQEQIEN